MFEIRDSHRARAFLAGLVCLLALSPGLAQTTAKKLELQVAQALEIEGNYETLQKVLERALEADPEDATGAIRLSIAAALERLGRGAEVTELVAPLDERSTARHDRLRAVVKTLRPTKPATDEPQDADILVWLIHCLDQDDQRAFEALAKARELGNTIVPTVLEELPKLGAFGTTRALGLLGTATGASVLKRLESIYQGDSDLHRRAIVDAIANHQLHDSVAIPLALSALEVSPEEGASLVLPILDDEARVWNLLRDQPGIVARLDRLAGSPVSGVRKLVVKLLSNADVRDQVGVSETLARLIEDPVSEIATQAAYSWFRGKDLTPEARDALLARPLAPAIRWQVLYAVVSNDRFTGEPGIIRQFLALRSKAGLSPLRPLVEGNHEVPLDALEGMLERIENEEIASFIQAVGDRPMPELRARAGRLLWHSKNAVQWQLNAWCQKQAPDVLFAEAGQLMRGSNRDQLAPWLEAHADAVAVRSIAAAVKAYGIKGTDPRCLRILAARGTASSLPALFDLMSIPVPDEPGNWPRELRDSVRTVCRRSLADFPWSDFLTRTDRLQGHFVLQFLESI
ncbi:MAG: hypothetical protein KDB53_16205, partial [Planctomycetes bacterium]|nr:hypothetical protein [Planctomycetota bacterium]